MKNYGFINNIGEIKQVQLNVYKGEGTFVGVTRNGFAYIYDGKEPVRLTKDEVSAMLNITDEQTSKLLKARGRIDLGSSKEDSNISTHNISDGENSLEVETKKTNRRKGKLDIRKEEKISRKLKPKESSNKNGDHESEAASLEEPRGKNALRKRVRQLEKEVAWLKENTVTKEQMLEIVKTITKGE